MSAFVVTDKTINKVVSYISAMKANGSDISQWRKTKLYQIGYDLLFPSSCAELAKKMFDMNVAAVNARYGEGEAEKFRPLDFRYRFTPSSLISVIKALESWSYQCTEGRVPGLALYQAMEEMHCLLCVECVHQLKEWELAPWD